MYRIIKNILVIKIFNTVCMNGNLLNILYVVYGLFLYHYVREAHQQMMLK